MQKIATRIFMVASIVFGFVGIIFVLTLPGIGAKATSTNNILLKLLISTGFIVLSSFALSVASKYLNNNKK